MFKLLPIPTIENIPPYDGAKPLCDMLDRQYKGWFDDTIQIEQLKDPLIAPARALNVMGHMFAADLQDVDTPRTKRAKITLAQDINKRRGMWLVVKDIIDSVVGKDARFIWQISKTTNANLFSVVGENESAWNNPDITEMYNNIQGENNTINIQLGIRVFAEDIELTVTGEVTKGLFLIDIGDPNYTWQQVEYLKMSLQGQICAYFRVILGYVDDEDAFIPFPNGAVF